MESIRGNLTRTVITCLIISIGIMSLVGILTAIDGVERVVEILINARALAQRDLVIDREIDSHRRDEPLRERLR